MTALPQTPRFVYWVDAAFRLSDLTSFRDKVSSGPFMDRQKAEECVVAFAGHGIPAMIREQRE